MIVLAVSRSAGIVMRTIVTTASTGAMTSAAGQHPGSSSAQQCHDDVSPTSSGTAVNPATVTA